MCGITGIINLDKSPVSSEILQKMTDTLVHRGPDGEGIYIEEFAGLGHRRLAILDLTPKGHQPMMSSDGRFAITYNGELYNFCELRAELESLGYQFKSKTDTEVVLYAYIKWGAKSLNRFNGMFAFALWDKEKKELFLARDRYGIKPLYYYMNGNRFLFASEIKAILASKLYKIKLNKEALLEYFTFQNIFTDQTLFSDIKLLPPASFIQLSMSENFLPKIHRYWDYCFSQPSKPLREEEYIEELNRLFIQAVKRQLVSDVSVGCYLSGGLDSGSITAIASQQLNDLKTFTIGFDLASASGMELAFDERKKAEYMSYLFKTEHYQMVLKAGDMERAFLKLIKHIEDPRMGQSYPNFYAAQLASKFHKVVLSGAGGDEFFAGYPWRYYRAVINADFNHYIDKYYKFWQRLLDDDHIKSIFAPIWKDVNHILTKNIFQSIFNDHLNCLVTSQDYINHSLYFEAKTFLHGLLIVEDKLSMAHGLEVRFPFLDNDLVDFAMKVPVEYKLGNLTEIIRLNENEPGPKVEKYFNRTGDGKLILRKVMQKHIPKAVTKLPKQGFSGPDASWFKGESMDYIKRCFFRPDSSSYKFLDKHTIEKLILEHLNGQQNRRLLIWSLLSFEEWCNQFI